MALKFGPAEYFTLMVFALTATTSLAGESSAKGMIVDHPRADDRHGRHRPAERPAALHLRRCRSCRTASASSSWWSACSRSPKSSSAWRSIVERHRAEMMRMTGPHLAHARGVAALGQADLRAAASSASSSACCRARAAPSPRSCPTRSRSGCRSTPRSSARARSKASPGPRRPTMLDTAGAMVPLLTLGVPGRRRDRGHAGRLHHVRHPARAAAVPEPARPGLGPDRQHVHRQHHAADPQPAADRAVRAAALHPDAASCCR